MDPFSSSSGRYGSASMYAAMASAAAAPGNVSDTGAVAAFNARMRGASAAQARAVGNAAATDAFTERRDPGTVRNFESRQGVAVNTYRLAGTAVATWADEQGMPELAEAVRQDVRDQMDLTVSLNYPAASNFASEDPIGGNSRGQLAMESATQNAMIGTLTGGRVLPWRQVELQDEGPDTYSMMANPTGTDALSETGATEYMAPDMVQAAIGNLQDPLATAQMLRMNPVARQAVAPMGPRGLAVGVPMEVGGLIYAV